MSIEINSLNAKWSHLRPGFKGAIIGFSLGYLVPLVGDLITLALRGVEDYYFVATIRHFFGIRNTKFIELSLVWALLNGAFAGYRCQSLKDASMRNIVKRIIWIIITMLSIFVLLDYGFAFDYFLGYWKT